MKKMLLVIALMCLSLSWIFADPFDDQIRLISNISPSTCTIPVELTFQNNTMYCFSFNIKFVGKNQPVSLGKDPCIYKGKLAVTIIRSKIGRGKLLKLDDAIDSFQMNSKTSLLVLRAFKGIYKGKFYNNWKNIREKALYSPYYDYWLGSYIVQSPNLPIFSPIVEFQVLSQTREGIPNKFKVIFKLEPQQHGNVM